MISIMDLVNIVPFIYNSVMASDLTYVFSFMLLQVPLRMIETVESRDMFQLQIICKDSKVVR